MNTIKTLICITIALVIFTWYQYLTVQSNIDDIQQNSIVSTDLGDTKYMEYCEWWFSDQKVEIDDIACIADYPWVFASNNLILLSILMILITLGTIGIQKIKK